MSQTDPFDITGKIALVTGASRGIGRAIAELLASRGAHVIVSSRQADACQAGADVILAAGGSAEALPCHIGEMEQIDSAFSAIESKHGRLDILVNNAATNPHFGPIALASDRPRTCWQMVKIDSSPEGSPPPPNR